MHVDGDRFLLLACALAACHEARQDRAAVTIAALPTPPPHAPDVCESLRRTNEQILANPPPRPGAANEDDYSRCPEEYAKEAPELLNNPEKRPPFLTYCHRSKGGTWAVVLVSVSLDDPGGEAPPCGWQASYQLIHVRDGDKPEQAVSTRKTDFTQWSNETDEWKVETVFDFDNDGQDEIVLSRHEWSNGGGVDGAPSHTIFRAGDKDVSPYPVGSAARIIAVRDVDRDGRPDLLEGFFTVACPEGLAGHTEYGAPLLLHSLADGTFSASDEAARRWAITQCPVLPVAATDFGNATCQRLWGRPVDAIGKELTDNGGDCSDQAATRAALRAPLPFKTLNIETPKPYPIKPLEL